MFDSCNKKSRFPKKKSQGDFSKLMRQSEVLPMNTNAASSQFAAPIGITQPISSGAKRGTRSRRTKCEDEKIQFCVNGEKHTMSGQDENIQKPLAQKCGNRQRIGNHGVKKCESRKAQGCREYQRVNGQSFPQREYSAVGQRNLTSDGARQYSNATTGLVKSADTGERTFTPTTSRQWRNFRNSCIAYPMGKHSASPVIKRQIPSPTINKQHQGKL